LICPSGRRFGRPIPIETWYKGKLREILDLLDDPETVDGILAASGGNFLYLRMFCEAVVRWNLDPTSTETLPYGLIGLYELWFRRQFPHQEDYEKALPLLELIVAAHEPVPEEWIDRLLGLGCVTVS
jgi:hypothetical protein